MRSPAGDFRDGAGGAAGRRALRSWVVRGACSSSTPFLAVRLAVVCTRGGRGVARCPARTLPQPASKKQAGLNRE